MSQDNQVERKEKTKIIDKLGFVCINCHKLLLVARSRGKSTFYIPGGKREPGESDIDALSREVAEELSVKLLSKTAVFLGLFSAQAHGKSAGVQVDVRAYSAQFKGDLQADHEIEELAWFSMKDKSRCSVVTQHIMDSLHAKGLITEAPTP
jgi:8-oxo-dGTP pyrophosphatase MutT (NUDIX family)